MPESFEAKVENFIGGSWLIQNEIAAGYRIVPVGSVPWLPADDWEASTIVSQGRFRVRLVALFARHPGHGALRRLVAAIQAQGRLPVVVEPFNDLAVTLRRWNCIMHPRTPWASK
jgi:hypothetical protein